MLSDPTIQLGQELFKWILIILTGIGVSMFLISYSDEVWDFLAFLLGLFRHSDQCADPDEDERWRRRQKVKKWTKIVKRKNRLRVKRDLAQIDRRTRAKAIDAVANTLATHEEILEFMYGDELKSTRSGIPQSPRRRSR